MDSNLLSSLLPSPSLHSAASASKEPLHLFSWPTPTIFQASADHHFPLETSPDYFFPLLWELCLLLFIDAQHIVMACKLHGHPQGW